MLQRRGLTEKSEYRFSTEINQSHWGPWGSCFGCTFLQNDISLRSIDLLSSDDVAGGVRKVDELAAGVKVQRSGIHQVFYGDHVLVWHFGVHVHAPDDPWATFAVHQEEFVFWFCGKMQNKNKKKKKREDKISVT